MERTFLVYIHTNLVNGKKYVGITSLTANQRWQGGKGYKNQFFGKAIEKYGWDNFSHEIIAENLSEQSAKDMEIDLISRFQSNNPNFGYNVTAGGDATNANLYQEVFQYNSTGSLINHFTSYGLAQKETGVDRKQIGDCCRGFDYQGNPRFTAGNFVWSNELMTPEQVLRIFSQAAQARTNASEKGSLESIRVNSMPIVQMDDNWQIVNSFSSQREASRITGIDQSAISKAIRGVTPKAGGYFWKKN